MYSFSLFLDTMDDQNKIKHDVSSYLGVSKLHIKKNILRLLISNIILI